LAIGPKNLIAYIEIASADDIGIDRRLLTVDDTTVAIVAENGLRAAIHGDLAKGDAKELSHRKSAVPFGTRK
jgi:hypothetical protein